MDIKIQVKLLVFLDCPLTNFLNYLYNKNLLEDISILFVSDCGLHIPRIHFLLSQEQFIHDRSISLLIMFYNDNNNKLNNNNQQKFITAYDNYETLLYICFGQEQFKNLMGKVYLVILMQVKEIVKNIIN